MVCHPRLSRDRASVLKNTGKAAAVQSKTISDMITSLELLRPRLTLVLLQWDLGIVLEALSKPPYEPLREASLKHLTLKTRKHDSYVSLQNSKSIPGKVKAQKVHAMATSLQLFNKVDLQAVMKA